MEMCQATVYTAWNIHSVYMDGVLDLRDQLLRTNTGNKKPFTFTLNKHVIKITVAIDAFVTQATCVTMH